MQILETSGWDGYELIDSGDGQRLERFGEYKIVKPDPQAIWKPQLEKSEWEKVDAVFTDKWNIKTNVPESWTVKYKDLSLIARLTPFKHTGIFPEQIVNWEYIEEKLKGSTKETKFLNLFGYTGVASLVAAKEGASVAHIDASRPAVSWLKENEKLNFDDSPIRVIVDDVSKFVEREVKRGNKYDAIIMDPPIYGHSPTGATWDFNRDFPKLMENISKILTDKPLFVIVNTYAISSSALMLESVMNDHLKDLGGKITVGEIALKEKTGGRLLSTGIFGRWEK